MPLYEYVCRQCGHQFEKLRKVSEVNTPVDCPKCGAPAQKRTPTGVDAHASRKKAF